MRRLWWQYRKWELKCQSTCHKNGNNDAKHNTLSFQILSPLFFPLIRQDEVQTTITKLTVEIIISSPSSAGETRMALSFCPMGTY